MFDQFSVEDLKTAMPLLKKKNDEEEEQFEVLNITDINTGWVKDLFKDVSKASVAKQTAVGAASGWCAGYLFSRVGKAAATAMGGTLLLLQIANHQGYVKINWARLEKDVKKYGKRIEKETNNALPAMVQSAQDFVRDNMFLAGGFTGGFLVGMAC